MKYTRYMLDRNTKTESVLVFLSSSAIGMISHMTWHEVLLSIFMAFLTGAVGTLGAYVVKRIINKIHKHEKQNFLH